ncbi:hypothetical protein [Microbacterium gorillae]|uniref:hypothetical protein n=1 Tax=Microbacterium gorillae TaxID=1231063 RepID=UPI003D95A3B0
MNRTRPLLVVALISATLTLPACSATTESLPVAEATPIVAETTPTPTPTPEAPLSLVGEWKTTNSASETSWQTAVITDTTITITWVSDGGSTTALYWAGSYLPPSDATTTYSWESANDTAQTSSALMASSDPAKSFHYDNGVLSYEASALGVTKTVTMERVG